MRWHNFNFSSCCCRPAGLRRSHSQTREKVRVALGSISVNTSVIPVGHQYGIFAKYGVDLKPIYMGGGMNSLAAVTSNTVQFFQQAPRRPSALIWAASTSSC